MADNLYTVSFDIPEQSASIHNIKAEAKRITDNRIIDYNIRQFETISQQQNQVVAVKASFTRLSPKDMAVNELRDKDLAQILKQRYEKLSVEARNSYESELKNRVEFRNVNILPSTDKRVADLNQNIAPVMRLYDRDNYTKVIVYQSPFPFIGLYRECLILVSTKTLELLNDAEIRIAFAHELAHEVFTDEMKTADQLDNNELRHLVEHKCDLVAVLAIFELNENHLAIIDVATKFSNWYQAHPIRSDLHEDWSPTIADRRDSINSFLKSNAVTAAYRGQK